MISLGVVLIAGPPASAGDDAKPPSIAEWQLADSLAATRNKGADLYNGNKVAECITLFTDALREARGTLKDHPAFQATIDRAFSDARGKTSKDDYAFVLHDAIAELAKGLKGNAVKDFMPPFSPRSRGVCILLVSQAGGV